MRITEHPSPNFDERGDVPIDMIIIHYTGMKTAQDALQRMCDNSPPRVSAHYFISRAGEIYRLVQNQKRAWHAGVASWQGAKNINARSIGIELENKGHEWGYQSFPAVQISSLTALLHILQQAYDIPAERIIGHSDVAPMRKQDPGELFPWDHLANQGMAIPSDSLIDKVLPYGKNTSTPIMIRALQKIGYDTDPVGFYTAKNRAALIAFLRRVSML